MVKYGKYPIVYRVLYIPGGASFLPSAVCVDSGVSVELSHSPGRAAVGMAFCLPRSVGIAQIPYFWRMEGKVWGIGFQGKTDAN